MNIGIIGCGWLGKPLAKYLAQDHTVTCYTREALSTSFWDNELFIIAISTKDNYLQSLRDFLSHIPSHVPIIFTSSTSVYKEYDKEVDESSVISIKSLQKEAEELIQNSTHPLLILRLGGLMGEDRIAGKWKSTKIFSDSPVNYIHLDDLIQIISKLIKKRVSKGIYNLVAPQHPMRSQVHQKNAKHFGFELGKFKGISHRIVNSNKIIKELNYTFIHPNPLEFWT